MLTVSTDKVWLMYFLKTSYCTGGIRRGRVGMNKVVCMNASHSRTEEKRGVRGKGVSTAFFRHIPR